MNLVSSCTFNVANGSAPVDLVISGGIYGSGGFTKSGAGLLQITGAGTYAGTTTISAGTLQVDGSLSTNNITVQSGATLAGNGTVGGPTAISSGGTLAPGDGPLGSLFFLSGITLNSGSKSILKLVKVGTIPENDLISTLGTLTLGGTLTVTNIGTNTLAAGDSFNLFSAATFSGTFSSKTLPALGTNLVWDTSQLTSAGIITVAALPAVNVAPATTNLVAGASAVLTATASGTFPLSYQWYDKNTNAIAGATNSTLLLAAVTTGATGNYNVIVTNLFGRATNVGAVMVSAPVPPVLSGAGVLTGGGFALTGTGTAGQAYVLLGASNLVPPVVWLPLATNSADTNGSINFNDPQAVNRSQRFYRLTTP